MPEAKEQIHVQTNKKSQTLGSHRLEKHLNLEGLLEKSLKIKYALKSTGKSLKFFEKSLNSLFSVGFNLLIVI